ncbi:MAG: ABC transporter ATP-binding protein [Ruminococcaceae bacterium]|nr:ABC transporter ATP-binding protein [Oscillospiraceae bacterium]
MKLAKRFILMAKSHWGEIIITVIALIGVSALSLVTPEVIRRMTAVLSDPKLLSSEILLKYAVILVAAYLVRGVLRFVSMYVSHIAAWKFVGELTLKVYDKYQELSMRYYQDKQTGQLMSRMVNDTRLLEVLIAHSLPDLITNVLVIIGVAIMIFMIDPFLALLTLIPVPFVVFVSSFFSKKVAPLFRINQEVLGDLNGVLQDNLSGMKEIQAFGKEKYEYGKMLKNTDYYSFVNIRANKANAIFHPSVEFLTSLGTVIVVGVGGVLAMNGQVSTSDIVGFFVYLSLFYQPLAILARLVEDVQTSLAGARRVAEVLDSESEIKESPDAYSLENVEGNISFENVSFDYINGEHVLNGISFNVKKGEMVALVGPTGVGKTTIVSLLERFYDPLSGKVCVDGHDIKNVTLNSLRKNISLVLQDVFLFNGTIEENIAYGVENCTREEVIAAAKAASADEFISKMPNGYDTMVGERGVRLSGGQKQRIAIARAVLRNTPILVLDEATSSVDTETEANIQTAIENLAGSRTIIVIAHRLSTVMRADNIVVLEKGQIVEQGSHSELFEKNGLYAKMCKI